MGSRTFTLQDPRPRSSVAGTAFPRSGDHLLSVWGGAPTIADVCHLDKWPALGQGQEQEQCHLPKSFGTTQGRKEGGRSTCQAGPGARCCLRLGCSTWGVGRGGETTSAAGPPTAHGHTRKMHVYSPELSFSPVQQGGFQSRCESKLCGMFWNESVRPPLLLTSAPPMLKARTSPVPTQRGIRHLGRKGREPWP